MASRRPEPGSVYSSGGAAPTGAAVERGSSAGGALGGARRKLMILCCCVALGLVYSAAQTQGLGQSLAVLVKADAQSAAIRRWARDNNTLVGGLEKNDAPAFSTPIAVASRAAASSSAAAFDPIAASGSATDRLYSACSSGSPK